jgi:hypothetical protein
MGKHDILQDKRLKALILARAHGLQADKYQKAHYLIGVPLVAISTASGTSAFATLSSYGSASPATAVVAGILSLIAAVLAGLQTFFDFSGKAAKLASATNQLSTLAGRDQPTEDLIAAAIKDAPRVPLKVQQQAQKAIEEEIGVPRKTGVMRFVVNKARSAGDRS